ncbi:MAG: type II toxin-antitoxin system HicA family toxin [Calditrichaeota bacterium]|nr:type II toxin-antitoxin system HicA family toxin [Calditrichota bacterium]
MAALRRLGFEIARTGTHMAMIRANSDGTSTPLTMPNHYRIKGSTLRVKYAQAGISRSEFLDAFNGL